VDISKSVRFDDGLWLEFTGRLNLALPPLPFDFENSVQTLLEWCFLLLDDFWRKNLGTAEACSPII
jgi:hypothetical protein